MRPDAMHRLAHAGSHDAIAPKPWHDVPKVSGDYDLDATILHTANRDMPDRLGLYTKNGRSGPLTGYNAYHNYQGDT